MPAGSVSGGHIVRRHPTILNTPFVNTNEIIINKALYIFLSSNT